MKQEVVARNYADALLAVALQHEAVERYGELMDAVAGAVSADRKVHAVLVSPRVTKAAKQALLARALEGVAPRPFVSFLGAIVRRSRQGILTEISQAYRDLVDLHLNREHASVVTARPVAEDLRAIVAERLTATIGKTVVPHFRTDPALVGGVIVRIGDRVFDGSLRRRLRDLRHRMLHAPIGRGS